MPIRYGRFEMPKTLTKDESTATDTYAKFTAEPFEAGYGHTVGNSLRRVLLSSLEGAAITAVKIAGAQHEFATLPNVVEDVTDIVLNLKKIKFKLDGQDHEPKKLSLNVNREGEVTAGDIQTIQGFEVLNPKQVICTLDRKHKFDAELEVRVGRGFATGEENKRPDQPIGLIPIDSIFSPVTRVKYAVENTRVGQRTDYDKLILEVWTDGRLTPDDALLQASAILRHHLDVFVHYNEEVIEFDQTPAGVSEDGPADEGNLPGFLHVALRYDLALSPPEQRDQIIARVAGITTRGEARQYLEEVAQRVVRHLYDHLGEKPGSGRAQGCRSRGVG